MNKFENFIRNLIGPFFIFWTVISFGLSGMEFKALASFGLVFFLILKALFHIFDIKISIAFLIFTYIIGSIYLLIKGKKFTESFAEIDSKDKQKGVFIVALWIIFAILANYLSFNFA